MPTLFVKCRSCRTEFPTPIAVTESGLQGVLITGLQHRCPQCGETNEYSTQDYFLPKALGDEASNSGSATVAGDQVAVAAAKRGAEAERLEGFGVHGSGGPVGANGHEGGR